MARKFKKHKAKRQSAQFADIFVRKYYVLESMLWEKAAGSAGGKLYRYVKWKRGMLKPVYENNWIEISNVGLKKWGCFMDRETKSNALRKLEHAKLIDLHHAPGKAVKVFRPDIRLRNGKMEYDD